MWRLALGVILSPLPRRWRTGFGSGEAIPWGASATLSGLAESMVALVGLVYWYSHSVTTWAANALDSALRNGPERQVPGQAIGFSARVLWLLHPLTWCIGFFFLEGFVRLLAAVATDQVVATFPLVMADWGYGKWSGRPLEGDAKHSPGVREQLREFVESVKQGIAALRSPRLPDECKELVEGCDLFLEIYASHAKAEWIPPRVVRVGDSYFRLEGATKGTLPRTFIYRLKRLAAGVPGRTVIVYEPPHAPNADVPLSH